VTVGALTRQTLLLAGQTWREGIRRRMLYVGFGLSLCFLVLYGLGVYFAFRHWENWATAGNMGGDGPASGLTSPEAIRDLAAYNMLSLAMFVSSFLGVMLAVFLASGMISGDKENGTLQTIVTRPVGRWQILLGRFLGFASIYLVYVVVLDTALIAVTRLFADFVPAAPIEAVLLLSVQGLILLGLTSVFTVVLPPIATGILAFMAFGMGFIAGVVQEIGVFLRSPTAEHLGQAVMYLIPSDVFFRMGLHGLQPRTPGLVAAVMQAGPFGSLVTPDWKLITYGLLYMVVALVIATRLFARRDL
jgi:Cu-processing system permease protein